MSVLNNETGPEREGDGVALFSTTHPVPPLRERIYWRWVIFWRWQIKYRLFPWTRPYT